MLARFEKVQPTTGSFTAYERCAPGFPFLWHYHPEFELILITDSEGQRMVGDSICDYRAGDLALLGSNLPHSYRSWPEKPTSRRLHRAIVIQFREECFGDRFFELLEMKPVAQMLQRSAIGLAFGHTEIGKEVADRIREIPSLPPAHRLVSLISVLVALATESAATAISTETLLPLCHVDEQRRIDKICSYIHQHFDQEIDFTELSDLVHLSQEALCRFFRRATGRTMTTYINQVRIGAATHLLTSTDLSVLEVGFRAGFGNYSNFNRQFKRIKRVTPLSLRRAFSATKKAADWISLSQQERAEMPRSTSRSHGNYGGFETEEHSAEGCNQGASDQYTDEFVTCRTDLLATAR
jgi:AraC-like DNA-binding protein